MPKIRKGFPQPPAGWELVEDLLDSYDEQMKEAIHQPMQDRRRTEGAWDVLKLSHKRTRELYDMFRRGTISIELLDYCASMGFVDGGLLEKWRQPGYEKLCCTMCVATKKFETSGSCVCRVPASKRHAGEIQCSTCGCTGCASGDVPAGEDTKKHSAGSAENQPNVDGKENPVDENPE